MSPNLTGIPVPFGALSLEEQITDEVVAHLATQLDPLNVVTVEEYFPQGDEGPRGYKRSALPAVYVYTTFNGWDYQACMTLGMEYTVHIGIVTEYGRTQEARRRHETIRENLSVFGISKYQGSTEFLGESQNPVSFDSFSAGEVQLGGEGSNPYMMWSENTMRCRVIVPDTVQE